MTDLNGFDGLISSLRFGADGLIPAVIVDTVSGKVLTLAYMNRESLRITLEKGLTCFWSRSRQCLWLKGETSGNYQHVVSVTPDCDRDLPIHQDPGKTSFPLSAREGLHKQG